MPPNLTEYERGLEATAHEITDFFGPIANIDLHHHNVMLDYDRQLVITDPLSFIGISETYHKKVG